MTLAKVKEQDGMTRAKVKEQDGMTLAKVRALLTRVEQTNLENLLNLKNIKTKPAIFLETLTGANYCPLWMQ